MMQARLGISSSRSLGLVESWLIPLGQFVRSIRTCGIFSGMGQKCHKFLKRGLDRFCPDFIVVS